ncbi:hypothetical protein EVAR_94660_1 [Eumeta japonica]|uniref:Uncharacterized protein n=1 Tax=Eumeta variegata TaxID=151549 RepID=A0A4C1UUB8_EUMVA|nr:hypothetical protein EVAR_94660_1 [Eumeta japonica]
MPSRFQLSTVPPPGLGAGVRLEPVRTWAVPCVEKDKSALRKSDNGQRTPLSLRLSVGGGDRPPSDGPQARPPS